MISKERENLPPLPKDFEPLFHEHLEKIRIMAARIREQRGRNAIINFGPIGASSSNVLGYNPNQSGRQRIVYQMSIPGHKAGLIIGPQGETLKRIEKMSQVKMQFDQHYSGPDSERKLIINGYPEDIEEAKRLITDKIDETSKYPIVTIRIPSTRVGLIIGKGGETIRELQERTGAKIAVNSEIFADQTSSDRILTITGEQDAINKAKQLVDDIISNNPRGLTALLNVLSKNTLTIQVPEHAVGALIGKKAEVLKQLQQNSNARIFIEPAPLPGTAIRNVHLSGSSEAITIAQRLVNEKVASIDAGACYYGFEANPGGIIYQTPGDMIVSVDPATTFIDYNQFYYGMQPSQEDILQDVQDPKNSHS